MAVLLPFTYGLDTGLALMLLAGVWTGANYGGSIPSILIRVPGAPSSAACIPDGYALTLQGHGAKALGVSLICGCIGGLMSVLVLMLLLVPLGSAVLAFGSPEIFATTLFGLTVMSSLAGPRRGEGRRGRRLRPPAHHGRPRPDRGLAPVHVRADRAAGRVRPERGARGLLRDRGDALPARLSRRRPGPDGPEGRDLAPDADGAARTLACDDGRQRRRHGHRDDPRGRGARLLVRRLRRGQALVQAPGAVRQGLDGGGGGAGDRQQLGPGNGAGADAPLRGAGLRLGGRHPGRADPPRRAARARS